MSRPQVVSRYSLQKQLWLNQVAIDERRTQCDLEGCGVGILEGEVFPSRMNIAAS